MLIAVFAALAAGASFATAGVLQQRAASHRPDDESLSLRLLGDLVQDKVWVIGISFAFLSYAFQALALANGPLTLVQPLIVSELIFAVPVSARLHGVRLGLREWLAAAGVAAGLAAAIFLASPRGHGLGGSLTGWLVVLGVVGSVTAAALLLGRHLAGPVRASLFAVSGASVMGTQSALFDVTIDNLRTGVVPLVSAWQTYLLVIASIGGLLLIQSAYQAGPLAASMPVIDAVEPVVAITIGLTLFHETLVDSVLRRGLAGLAMGVVILSIVVLDTSPVTQRVHRLEQGEQEDDDEDDGHDQDQDDGTGADEPEQASRS